MLFVAEEARAEVVQSGAPGLQGQELESRWGTFLHLYKTFEIFEYFSQTNKCEVSFVSGLG